CGCSWRPTGPGQTSRRGRPGNGRDLNNGPIHRTEETTQTMADNKRSKKDKKRADKTLAEAIRKLPHMADGGSSSGPGAVADGGNTTTQSGGGLGGFLFGSSAQKYDPMTQQA